MGSNKKTDRTDKNFTKDAAQIHLRPLCYLGNLQSGVHVVRKTALNYSERENVRQTCGHTPPNMWLARRCMHHVTAINLTHRNHIYDIFAHYLQRMSLSIDGCIVSSNRSSCTDGDLLYIYPPTFRFSLSPLMQLMLQVSL